MGATIRSFTDLEQMAIEGVGIEITRDSLDGEGPITDVIYLNDGKNTQVDDRVFQYALTDGMYEFTDGETFGSGRLGWFRFNSTIAEERLAA